MFTTQKINVYILPNAMGQSRIQVFRNALIKNGACVFDDESSNKNMQNDNLIVLVDNSFDDYQVIDKIISKKKMLNVYESDNIKFVKSCWLSDCLKNKNFIDFSVYEIKNPIKNSVEDSNDIDATNLSESKGIQNKRCLANDDEFDLIIKQRKLDGLNTQYSKFSDSEDDSNFDSNDLNAPQVTDNNNNTNNNNNMRKVAASWVCSHSSKEQLINYNKDVTDKLEQLLAVYQNTNDKYRALGYQKAIAVLKRHPTRITTWEEARSLYGIGSRLADKIWEIIQTGELQKLDEFNSRDDLNSIKIFTNIHGVGPTTAQMFVSQGFNTINDLKTKANLNKQQKIGINYYDEFLQRIPRDEVEEIEKFVRNVAIMINPRLIVQACGSYRRQKSTCGDVDILITHPDGQSHKGIFNKLIDSLHKESFLTDDLVSQEESGNQKKYFGVCCLPGEKKLHRRLDIIVVPYDEYACALLYFTGSAHFNRSMRLLARKMGMSLSEHSLNKNVIRKGTDKLNTGEKLYTPTEKSIFDLLNLTYRPPEERDF